MFKKPTIIIITLFTALLILAPLAVYNYSLSLLDTMPAEPQSFTLTKEQLSEQWATIEPNVTLNSVGNITPYWIYTWLIAAILNDALSLKYIDPYDSISAMASEIAIHHMRESNVNIDGRFWWHMVHANLGIWLQRNWEPEEILVKYNYL